ncbi:hypothetical protein ZHAS_00004807 [Anopheles sinensis]|uniref:Uncharacterized protein n=1 Tax=Anopheles sinensis TaxID=74873 RepID=A0A084VHS8_ANOSI|nr:hypothetical protein ZHAS_00004807 [Anopheles sinensis]
MIGTCTATAPPSLCIAGQECVVSIPKENHHSRPPRCNFVAVKGAPVKGGNCDWWGNLIAHNLACGTTVGVWELVGGSTGTSKRRDRYQKGQVGRLRRTTMPRGRGRKERS